MTAATHRLGSSLRCRNAAETLTLAASLMPALGISRVTDTTRLDRLGLPVFASIRPRGLALCVNAGKGIKAEEARVGAVMEAIEFAVAEPERTPWERRTTRLHELAAHWADELTLMHFSPRIGASPDPERLLETVRCDDVAGGRSMWLPAELIFVPFDDPHGEPLFGWSTNGLASGNSLAEATLHALLEVLERDSLALNLPRDESLWLDPGDLPEPFLTTAAEWRRLGIDLSVRHVPNDFGLPCFSVVLHEGDGAAVALSHGSALHLDAGIALARAVCEAAQSRLSHIHGGRDDITHYYATHGGGHLASPAHETLAYREAFDTRRRIAWREVPTLPCEGQSLERILAEVVDRLRGLGFPQVFRHRFDIDLNGLCVVKLVVPRCEEVDNELLRLGERLFARMMTHG